MKNECSIIRDLLPLYVENMVSPDTAEFMEEHLKGCEACQKEFQQVKQPRKREEIADAAPLLKLSRKMKAKRIQTIALTVVFVIALCVSAFAALDAPIYFPYSEELVTIEQQGDKGMLLTFAEEVTDFEYIVYADPDRGDFYYCDIQAWTSIWDQWFSKGKGQLSTTVTTKHNKPIIALYIPSDGSNSICIAKYDPNAENCIEKDVKYEQGTALPRLSLGYYLIFAAALLVVAVIAWFLAGKKAELRTWVERIGLYPISYIIGHCIVSGVNTTSYSFGRDFFLTIFISLLLYSGLLLAHSIWRLKKEIKTINK